MWNFLRGWGVKASRDEIKGAGDVTGKPHRTARVAVFMVTVSFAITGGLIGAVLTVNGRCGPRTPEGRVGQDNSLACPPSTNWFAISIGSLIGVLVGLAVAGVLLWLWRRMVQHPA